jgi:hypothetical protein
MSSMIVGSSSSQCICACAHTLQTVKILVKNYFRQIVGWTLLQVVVAVLIDNFTASADEEKEKAMKEKAMRQGKNVAISALDPILAALAHFNTSQDLSDRVTTLFKVWSFGLHCLTTLVFAATCAESCFFIDSVSCE